MVGLSAVKAFSLVVASGDRSLVVVHRLLAVVAPLVAEHRLRGTRAQVAAVCGLGSWGSQVLEHRLNSCGTGA